MESTEKNLADSLSVIESSQNDSMEGHRTKPVEPELIWCVLH